MWYLLQAVHDFDTGSKELIREISQVIARSLTFVLVGLFLAGAYLLGAINPGEYLSYVLLLTLLVVTVAWLSVHFIDQYPLASHIVWQAGMIGAVTLALFLFQTPEIAFFYLLFPLIAVIVAGWPMALVVEAVIIGLMVYFGQHPAVFPLVERQPVVIITASLLVGLIGALATGAMLSVVQRAFKESKAARDQIEESWKQRMELIQTQEDLLLANRELARLSDGLKAMMQIAEDARRVKEEFVANVSHELRTPLNMIIGFSELIAKAPRIYGNLPPSLLADIAAIQRNSQHLSDLVNDVLDLSQADAGRMTLIRDWTTLQELVEMAVSATKILFDNKGLYLHTNLPPEPVHLFCDRTRIREVLLNLLSNAGRFTDHGGVTITAETLDDRLIVCVADTGPGIAPENQARLFEPFQQLDNSIRRQGGSGLGLSISKRFVEMHDGKMWLESQVGSGTTFFFSLPLLIPSPPAHAASGASRWITPYHQPDVEFHRSKAPAPVVLPRYVLLDKSGALKRLFSRQLQNVEITCEEDLDSAIDTLRRSPCQGLVINSATTGVSGDALRQSGKIPFVTPVITCSIPGNDDLTHKLGVVDYLLKPISARNSLLRSTALATPHGSAG
jgi:signal transduction histidine kinase/CheY-like chemotaxis protein